jgi:hypothetical protein
MSPEEQIEFAIDVQAINWSTAIRLYFYGLQKYILLQDVVNPAIE